MRTWDKIRQKRQEEQASILTDILITITLIGLGLMIMFPVLVYRAEEAGHISESQDSAPTPSANPVSIPWGAIIIVGIILVSIAIVVGIGYFVYNQYQRIQAKKDHQRDLVTRLESIKESHNKVLAEWSNYELSLEMSIRYPLITDTSHPITEAFYQTLQKASLASPNRNIDQSSVKEYEQVVGELTTSFSALISKAKRHAWSEFSKNECRRLETALNLLSMARNEGASPHERQVAYKRAMSELDGLITLPEAPVAALESSVMQQIEAMA